MSRASLFQSTVARQDGDTWWLMNRQEGGWDSSGIPFPSLDALTERFDVRLGEHGRDEHGPFVRVLAAS